MDKVIVNPEHIRGAGNIVVPLVPEDFLKHRANISSTTAFNNTRCFSLVFYGNNLVLTVPNPYVGVGETITVYATLTDHDGEGIELANISLYVEEE